MPTQFAEVIDGLTGQWVVGSPLPTGGPIAPYQTGAGGGYVAPAAPVQPPRIGSPTTRLDAAFDSATYVTPSGQRAWMPDATERAFNARYGFPSPVPAGAVDNLVPLPAAATARTGSRVAQSLPYVGDVVGGVVEGAVVYGRTGSLTHATFAGGGAAIGGIAGTTLGSAIGAMGGPVGVVAGGIVGGIVGSAIGSLLGQGLANIISPLPSANKNNAQIAGVFPYETMGQSSQLFQVYWQYRYAGGAWQDNQYVGISQIYPYRTGSNGSSVGCPGGTSNIFYALNTHGLAAGCGAEVRDIRIAPWPTDPNFPLQTIVIPVNFDSVNNPNAPKIQPQPINLPGPTPIPTPRPTPTPTPWPTPLPGPGPTPTPGPDPIPFPVPVPVPVPTGDDKKDPYPRPTPTPTPNPRPNPNLTEQPGPDDGDCDPCAELKIIRAKLEETFTLAWALPECGTDFSVSRNGEKSGQGLGGLSQKIDGLHQILKVLHDNTRCEPPPPIATVPEWWQVRVGADRPQLVVLYAEIKKDGSLGQSRWPLTIPWFNASLRSELKRRLPSYNKGQWQGMLTLNDNSKILVHARTKTEAESTINTLARIIVSEQRPKPIAIVTGERQGTALKKVSVVPTVAHFYPTGQKNMKPAWTEKIR